MCLKYYKDFKKAAGDTAKSILISTAVRLQAFNIPEVMDLTCCDNIHLEMIGDEKTVMYIIIPSSDDTFNFLAAMMYTQLFDVLYDRANFKHGGRLPFHVRCLLDEFANVGTIPRFEELLATMRSMEISANVIIQNLSQLKKMYKDSWENVLGNCDSLLFLGGQELTTLEHVSKTLGKETIDMNVSRIDKYLVCLLKDCFHTQIISGDNEFIIDCLECLKQDLNTFWEKGQLPELKHITRLRSFIYGNGSDLQLLLNDIFCAIYLLKIHNSAVQLLPKYMQLDSNELSSLLYYKDSLKELWPSQRKLGVEGVFAGKSAVIQMPTSSGKTKSISMIISSAFISNRTRLAVVIAPFRALCREISNDLARDFIYDKTIHVDELSDVFQKEKIPMDTYDSEQKTVLVATPEKFMYMMRQRSDLAKQIGVVVFDEGHLFDEPERGVVYELLMSTIKTFIGDECQKVLVSAIIPNAAQISDWLNKEYGVVISDNTIKSTQKTIAMTDWQGYGTEKYGYLYFLNPEQPDEEEFYVPRVISIIELNKFKKERKRRMFPDVDFKKRKVSYNDIAIYYGLTL